MLDVEDSLEPLALLESQVVSLGDTCQRGHQLSLATTRHRGPSQCQHSPCLQWSCRTRRLALGLSRMRHFPTVFSSEGSERKTPRKDYKEGTGMGTVTLTWHPSP